MYISAHICTVCKPYARTHVTCLVKIPAKPTPHTKLTNARSKISVFPSGRHKSNENTIKPLAQIRAGAYSVPIYPALRQHSPRRDTHTPSVVASRHWLETIRSIGVPRRMFGRPGWPAQQDLCALFTHFFLSEQCAHTHTHTAEIPQRYACMIVWVVYVCV